MRSFDDFADYMKVGRRQGFPGRPLCRNTRVYYEDPASKDRILIRLYSTDIITYFKDGRIAVSPCGYFTRTTRDRINEYSPFRIYGWRKHARSEMLQILDISGNWPYWSGGLIRDTAYVLDPGPINCIVYPDKRRKPRDEEAETQTLLSLKQYLVRERRDKEQYRRACRRRAKKRASDVAKFKRLLAKSEIRALFRDLPEFKSLEDHFNRLNTELQVQLHDVETRRKTLRAEHEELARMRSNMIRMQQELEAAGQYQPPKRRERCITIG